MTNPTHILLNRHGVVDFGTDEASLREDFAASLATGESTLYDLTTADVATIARIAAADCPTLTRKGTGFLGEGTHPAQPYLEAMLTMVDVGAPDGYNVNDIRFGLDSATGTIRYFLTNASAWRGDVARAGKARLKQILEG